MKQPAYKIGKLSEQEQWEFDCHDSLSRTIDERIRLGFVHIKLPCFYKKPYRIFSTMKEYRGWLNKEVPRYLGYNQIHA